MGQIPDLYCYKFLNKLSVFSSIFCNSIALSIVYDYTSSMIFLFEKSTDVEKVNNFSEKK